MVFIIGFWANFSGVCRVWVILVEFGNFSGVYRVWG